MDETIKTVYSSSGIPIITESISNAHSAYAAVFIGSGSRDETPEQAGIAHLLEHMMFKGSSKYTSKEMSEKIEAAGGMHNAYTSHETTCYYLSTLDETFESTRDILSDMISSPCLSQSDLETERNVVIQEIRMDENDPGSYIHELFAKTLWGDHPMGRSEAGTIETVKSITSEDLHTFYEKNYRPPKMVVVAVGNIDVDSTVTWASESFDDFPKVKSNERTPPTNYARFAVYPKKDPQAYVSLGFPAFSVNAPEKQAQRILSVIFGVGMSSRLFQEVREKTGLVYDIHSMGMPYTDCGMFCINYNTDVKHEEEVIRMVAEEIRKLKSEGLRDGELERAKHLIKGVYARRSEVNEERMNRLGSSYISTGEAASTESILNKMGAVTEEEIMKVIESIMVRGNLSIAIHAPKRESEKVIKSIKDLDF